MTAELLQKIQAALTADLDLLRYCRDEIGRLPTVQIDFDEEQELDVSCYPFIGILTVKPDTDIRNQTPITTLGMLAAVRNSAVVVDSVAIELDGELVAVPRRTYPGRLQAETLREKALLALFRAKLGKIVVSGDALSHTYHPKFYSPFTVTIEERN
jgi:hypothetical protein